MGRRDLLNQAELQEAMVGLDWRRDGDALEKRAQLATFPSAGGPWRSSVWSWS